MRQNIYVLLYVLSLFSASFSQTYKVIEKKNDDYTTEKMFVDQNAIPFVAEYYYSPNSKGIIWLKTGKKPYSTGANKTLAYDGHEVSDIYSKYYGLDGCEIYKDSKDNLWFYNDSMLLQYKNYKFTKYDNFSLRRGNGSGNISISAIHLDNSSRLWFLYAQESSINLCYFSLSNHSVKHLSLIHI